MKESQCTLPDMSCTLVKGNPFTHTHSFQFSVEASNIKQPAFGRDPALKCRTIQVKPFGTMLHSKIEGES